MLQITNRKTLVIWNRGTQIAGISPKSQSRAAQIAISNRAICDLNVWSNRRQNRNANFLYNRSVLWAFSEGSQIPCTGLVGKLLSDPTEVPPLLRDKCSNTPAAPCFLWYRRLSPLYPTSFHKNGLSKSKDRPNKGGIAEKACSDAYRATGGVARNSIANRAIVGH